MCSCAYVCVCVCVCVCVRVIWNFECACYVQLIHILYMHAYYMLMINMYYTHYTISTQTHIYTTHTHTSQSSAPPSSPSHHTHTSPRNGTVPGQWSPSLVTSGTRWWVVPVSRAEGTAHGAPAFPSARRVSLMAWVVGA